MFFIFFLFIYLLIYFILAHLRIHDNMSIDMLLLCNMLLEEKEKQAFFVFDFLAHLSL